MNETATNIPKKSTILIFFIFLGIYFSTMGGHLYSPDEELLFRTTEAIAVKRSLAIQPIATGFATKQGVDGNEYAQYGVGQPVAAVPFYFLGKILQNTLPASYEFWQSQEIVFAEAYHGQRDGPNGSYWLRFGVSLYNQFLTAAFVTLIFLFCFELSRNHSASLITAVLFGLGSIVWPHSKTFFTESSAAFCLVLSFYFVTRGARTSSLTSWAIAGFFAGYSVLTRNDSVIMLPGLILYCFLCCRGGKGDEKAYDDLMVASQQDLSTKKLSWHPDFFKRVIVFGIPSFFCLVALLMINQSLYGSPLETGYSDQQEGVKFATPLHIGLYGQLFSFGKGFFFYSPALVLFFLSIRKFWQQHFALALSLLVSIVAFLLVMSKWQNWGGGWCWGPRHIIQLAPLLAIPIVSFVENWEKIAVKIVTGVFLICGIVVQIYGCSQSFNDFYWYHFRLPFEFPTARVQYSPMEDEPVLGLDFLLFMRNPRSQNNLQEPLFQTFQRLKNDSQKFDQEIKPVPFRMLPAPLSSSFWVPEHTPWYGYAALWREQQKHDFFWLWVLGIKPKG